MLFKLLAVWGVISLLILTIPGVIGLMAKRAGEYSAFIQWMITGVILAFKFSLFFWITVLIVYIVKIIIGG